MRAPLIKTPTATRKSDGSIQLDDIDESTLLYWEERTKESESTIGKAARKVASLLADSKIVRDRFTRVFMRVSVRRGAGSLLLYERELNDGAPLRVYDLTYTTDVTKEDLPQKEALGFTVKDNLTGTQESVCVFGQILLRLHFAPEGDVTEFSSGDGKKSGKNANDNNNNGSSSSSSGSTKTGKLRDIFHDIGGKSLLHAGTTLVAGDNESQNRSVCFAFFTTEDRDAWYKWFAELVVLRQRSIIESTSTDFLLDDVDEAGTRGSLFGFTSAFSRRAMLASMNQQRVASGGGVGVNEDLAQGIDDDGAGGANDAAMMEQLSRVPVVGEKAFLRCARGRDALRNYSRHFLESGNSILSDTTSQGSVQFARGLAASASFSSCELTGILGVGEITLKFKLLGSLIIRDKLDVELAGYRIEASASSERDIFLKPIVLGNLSSNNNNNNDSNNNNNDTNAKSKSNKNNSNDQLIRPQRLMESYVIRAPNFEARATIITWLRRVKGKGEIAQSEEETFPYLARGMFGNSGTKDRNNDDSNNNDNNNSKIGFNTLSDDEGKKKNDDVDDGDRHGSPSLPRNILPASSAGSPTNFGDFDVSKKSSKKKKKILKKRLISKNNSNNNNNNTSSNSLLTQNSNASSSELLLSRKKKVTTFKIDGENQEMMDEEEFEYYYEEEEADDQDDDDHIDSKRTKSQNSLLHPFETASTSTTSATEHQQQQANLSPTSSTSSAFYNNNNNRRRGSRDSEKYENDSNNPRTPDSSRSASSLNGGPAVSVSEFIPTNYFYASNNNFSTNHQPSSSSSFIVENYVMDDARLHLYGAANANISGIVFGLSNNNNNITTSRRHNNNSPPLNQQHSGRSGILGSSNNGGPLQMNGDGKLQPFLKMISPPPQTSTSWSSNNNNTRNSANNNKRFSVRPTSPAVSKNTSINNKSGNNGGHSIAGNSSANSKPLVSAGTFSRHDLHVRK